MKCKCQTGFHLTTEKRCEIDAAEGPPSILFAMGHQVLELDAANHEYFAKFTDPSSASSVLAFDISIGNSILYIVTADHETRRCRLMSSTRGARANAIFKHHAHLGEIVDLAVDWITNNLYIVDALISSIVVCRPSEEICAQIFTELGSAHYIVLDPIEGRLFWSDLDDNKKGIYEGSMDGKLKKALVTERVTKPYGLALDLFASRLYWLEAADLRVKFVRTDSGVRGELIALPANRYPSGLAVFGDHLYWSDLGHHSSKVASCDKLTGKNVTIHTETNSGKFIFTLRAYHPLMQPPRKNPCKSNPCSHLCVISGPSEKSFACLCPSYYKLVSKTQCELSTASFMMAASEQLIFVPSDAALGQDLSATTTAKKIPHVATMAFDDAENMLYAVEDNGTPRMIRIKLEDNYQPETVNVSIDYVTTMHFDPIHRLLYWLDISQAVIGVYNPQRNEESRFRLENPDVTSPIDFAVDFSRGQVLLTIFN